ncbi:cation:proton antiporter, partial [Halarchaeum acidiphilum]|uniref:cation:proton antiporter n=1 Tax=Halarchaeum acidiphilum TaxID=489138 RepID=UPI000375FDE3
MALEFAFVSALLVVYGTSYVFTFLRRWDVPLLAVEILAGIVFGSAFGFISPGSAGYDFFEALAAFGLLMIMFDAGLELDPEVVREDPLRVAKLGLLTFVLPFLAGVGFALALSLSPFAAYLTGVTVSTTSLGLIYPLVEDYGLVDDDRGQLILSVTVLNDILSVAALAYGVTLVTSDSPVLASASSPSRSGSSSSSSRSS